MWRSSVSALLALATACGNRHESAQSAPSERPHAVTSQPLQNESAGAADAGLDVDGPTASAPVVDAPAEEPPPANDPTKEKSRAPSISGQRKSSRMRCTLRVSSKGIYVDGDPKSRAEAVAACKRTAGAMVVLEDNAPADEWKALETALRRESLPILMRGPVNDNDCLNNPLAKRCN